MWLVSYYPFSHLISCFPVLMISCRTLMDIFSKTIGTVVLLSDESYVHSCLVSKTFLSCRHINHSSFLLAFKALEITLNKLNESVNSCVGIVLRKSHSASCLNRISASKISENPMPSRLIGDFVTLRALYHLNIFGATLFVWGLRNTM